MMGSGSSGRFREPSADIGKKIAAAQQHETDRLNSAVNGFIAELLAKTNARDPDVTNRRLDALAEMLGDVSEVEKLLLGGSVAKHTDVDGLSDVDALVVLDRKDLEGKSPNEVKAAFAAELYDRLPRSEVKSVREGQMAVTVTYVDNDEIQLIPALRSGIRVMMATPDGNDWKAINLRTFQAALTDANKRLGRALVPAIKLLKSINSDLPVQKRLKSYHIEALAVDAIGTFAGANVPREVLIHLCKHASERVLRPISDVTGQSRRVDDYLGTPNSLQRRIVSQALLGVGRRLEAAGSVEEWRSVFGSDE